MFPVSSDFRAAVVSGTQIPVVRAVVSLGDSVLGDLTLKPGGSVVVDSRRDGPLRSLSLTCAPDPDVWDWLTTYGAEIKVWRGFSLPTGDELVPLGVFVIDGELSEDQSGVISLSAADRAARISRAHWTDPYTVTSGTDLGTAVVGMLTDRWPSCPTSIATLGVSVNAQVVFQPGSDSDPWKDARLLASDLGYDLYFDNTGVARIRAIPNPATTQPCMTYYDGELSIVLGSNRKASMANTYNGVIATGEGSDVATPVRGEAWDDDPSSPTYRRGPLGMIPSFYSSPLLTTQAEADAAALTRLSKVKGRTEQMEWSLITNPAHEAFDVISFTESASGLSRLFMLDSVTIPLDNQSMNATARETQVT